MREENKSSTTDFIFLGLFPEMKNINFLIYSILLSYIIALSGNTILILLIWMHSRLHTPMYLFLSQLSIMDLILTSTTIPRMITDFWSEKRNISQISCGIQIFFYMTIAFSECVLLTLMSYDRYVAVCNPLRYPMIMNPQMCLWMVIIAWIGGILNAIVHTSYTMHFPFCGSKEIQHYFCEIPAILKFSCEATSDYELLILVTGIVLIFIPFGFIMASYVFIFYSVLHMKSQEGRNKALVTCSSHLMVVSLYMGPGMIICLIPHSWYSPQQEQAISLFYNVLTPMLNPLIYSLRNKEVIGALKKTLGWNLASNKRRKILIM